MALVHVAGVGKMGLPMAGHLQAAGHAVTVSDPSEVRLQLARGQGLAVADEAGAAMARADMIFSSLPDDAALRQVASQVAQSARRGAVYIDTSTVSQQASAEVAQVLAAAGVLYVRSAVSGNNKMAEAAQLTVMASGPRAAYDSVLPLLKTLGPNQFYLGEAEQARLMKLVVNLMIAQTSAMLAEALTLGRKGGLGWADMWQVLGASAVASPIVKAKSAQLSQRDFTPTFTVEQMIKDLTLILGAGADSHVPLPQTALTYQLLHAALAQGDGQDDYAAIIKTVERSAGLDTRLQDKS
ncbi:MAG: NAD(P)-dependent oxidoreductase [Polaromonas sp.]|uniref:NAD(P)-dependent oxidoreductase n=1 Tax=Polaromonas sp. TaxID=1869339 RepID=UPI002731C55D|nr:NAD(P)-dependent oxidoreductase [Polaromonas sp.]MDP2450566.1 NAD(P)-dependent oxidoreductase [Polaromonas sp.]MDP3250023.1 NAD(P)-dependent oxidoreductase [Polaromonas sp.]MDP3757328.1 NAD(P)-dependent oxidoreductase [Polaromonas sp.]MDP3829291.1 NAD(P)-dependent oxidoreductase [Polaromonas sp.]